MSVPLRSLAEYFIELPASRQAITLHAMLRYQPGYTEAASGDPVSRAEWTLNAIATLPDKLSQQLPAGCVTAAREFQAALPLPAGINPRLLTVDAICRMVAWRAEYIREVASRPPDPPASRRRRRR